VAVEYASWQQDVSLFDEPFETSEQTGLPFATLHAWVWQGNPAGTFTGHNPNVRCPDEHAEH